MLNIKQKSALRKIAVQNKVLKFTIGKGSIDSNVLSMLDNTITKHELIKIAFLKDSLGSLFKAGLFTVDLQSSTTSFQFPLIPKIKLITYSNYIIVHYN